MAKVLRDTLKIIEKYKAASPYYGELLEILEEILILREEYRLKVKEPIFRVDETIIEKKVKGGLPLVDFASKNLNLTEAQDYFLALLTIAEKRVPDGTKEITQKLEEGTLDFIEMVRDSFNPHVEKEGTEDSEEEEVFDLLGFLLEESLRPSLEILADKYEGTVTEIGWTEGYCPICGREPKIGELKGEEGKKYLFCNQCGFEWQFPRVKCPFCGNEDQKTLAYFTIENEEKYRVDVCNECNKYVKTIDFRELKEEANLDIEDIATLHLDILANEEGYE